MAVILGDDVHTPLPLLLRVGLRVADGERLPLREKLGLTLEHADSDALVEREGVCDCDTLAESVTDTQLLALPPSIEWLSAALADANGEALGVKVPEDVGDELTLVVAVTVAHTLALRDGHHDVDGDAVDDGEALEERDGDGDADSLRERAGDDDTEDDALAHALPVAVSEPVGHDVAVADAEKLEDGDIAADRLHVAEAVTLTLGLGDRLAIGEVQAVLVADCEAVPQEDGEADELLLEEGEPVDVRLGCDDREALSVAERLIRAVALEMDTVERAVALLLTDGVTDERSESDLIPEGLVWKDADTDDVVHPLGVAESEDSIENEEAAVRDPRPLSVALAEAVRTMLPVGLADTVKVAEGLNTAERLDRLDTLRRALAEKLAVIDGEGDADEERVADGERDVVEDKDGERLAADERDGEGDALEEPEVRGDREPLDDVEELLEDDTDALTVAVELGVADAEFDEEVLAVDERDERGEIVAKDGCAVRVTRADADEEDDFEADIDRVGEPVEEGDAPRGVEETHALGVSVQLPVADMEIEGDADELLDSELDPEGLAESRGEDDAVSVLETRGDLDAHRVARVLGVKHDEALAVNDATNENVVDGDGEKVGDAVELGLRDALREIDADAEIETVTDGE